MINSKKGVSPLIATVLIIALTVALTVFLMNWAFGFFKERTSETSKTTTAQLKCVSAVDFDIDCSCQTPDVGKCFYTVTNNNALQLGDVGVTEKIYIRLISSDQKVVTGEILGAATLPPLNAFEIKDGNLTKKTGSKEPFDLEVIVPKIKDNTTGLVTECGSLAKLRKACDMNAPS